MSTPEEALAALGLSVPEVAKPVAVYVPAVRSGKHDYTSGQLPMRDGSLMVMGIVSTKTPALEDEDDLLRRMEEAAGFAGGMDRLAISPQCGFASVMVGNEIDEDAQWRKLELVARVADRLWPRGASPG